MCVSQFSFLQADAVCECLFLHVNISSLCVCVCQWFLSHQDVCVLTGSPSQFPSASFPPHPVLHTCNTHGHTNTHLAPRSSEAENTDTAEAFKNITHIQ